MTGRFFGVVGVLSLFCMTAAYAGQTKPAAPTAAKPAATKAAEHTKATPASIAAGQVVFKRQCQACHGATGVGDGPAAKTLKGKLPNMTDKAYMAKITDAQMLELITNGRKSEIGNMPAMGKRLKPAEMTDVINFVRSLAK